MPFSIAGPCHTCRQRHLKCDGKKPTCERCQRLNKKCEFPGLVIKNAAEGQFPDDQPWLRISTSRFQFVDESIDLANYYGHFESFLSSGLSNDRPIETETGSTISSSYRGISPSSIYELEELSSITQGLSNSNWVELCLNSPLDCDKIVETTPTIQDTSVASIESSPELVADFFNQEVKEAYLMRYFIEELAQWFDTCDLDRHFATVAPHRAASCPALLYAIFSASARHISRRNNLEARSKMPMQNKRPNIGPEVALEYQNLCISQLMALSGDASEVKDENLLAASVILRFYEELDAPLIGADDETYLNGTLFFLAAQSEPAVCSRGLQNAAFWVGIRQKIHAAFIQQRSIQFDFHCFDGSNYKTIESADDSTWANRIVLHCAEILAYCYGNESRGIESYKRLIKFSEDWYAYKPSSFNPIYYQAPNIVKKEIFPQIWFLGDCHVTAIQHWHLAQILLAAFDPRVPRMGPNQKKAVAEIEGEIKKNMFSLCGIGFSNKTAPGPITACMGVSMCGDRITNRFEQEALLDVLIKTEELQALSTKKAQSQLIDAWEWY